jgi:hypothetical protein
MLGDRGGIVGALSGVADLMLCGYRDDLRPPTTNHAYPLPFRPMPSPNAIATGRRF